MSSGYFWKKKTDKEIKHEDVYTIKPNMKINRVVGNRVIWGSQYYDYSDEENQINDVINTVAFRCDHDFVLDHQIRKSTLLNRTCLCVLVLFM